MNARVVIAEDAALFRAGLARLIEDHGHRVCAAVGDGDALLAAVAEHQPDVVVADIRMPPTHTDEGLRAALEIRRQHPRTGVLVLSQYIETKYTARLLQGNAAGAGYVLKERVADVAEFADALERVRRGRHRARPRGRRPAATRQPPRRRPRGAHRARAPRARADGGGAFERWHRRRARGDRRNRGEARGEHLRQARAAPGRGRQPPRPRGPALPGLVAPWHPAASMEHRCSFGFWPECSSAESLVRVQL
jgi:DNA-binding NarL/FixJ family response regulator